MSKNKGQSSGRAVRRENPKLEGNSKRPYSNKKGGPMKSADNRTKWMEDQSLAEKKY